MHVYRHRELMLLMLGGHLLVPAPGGATNVTGAGKLALFVIGVSFRSSFGFLTGVVRYADFARFGGCGLSHSAAGGGIAGLALSMLSFAPAFFRRRFRILSVFLS